MACAFEFSGGGLSAPAVRLAAIAALLSMMAAAVAQERGQPQQTPAQSAAPATPNVQPSDTPGSNTVAPLPQSVPEHKPGMLESFGRWFDESAAGMRNSFDDTWRGTGQAAKGTADVAGAVTKGAFDAAKGTADAFGKLGGSRVVNGRERCVIAPNGAPDCKVAAVTMCKSNGYKDGDSVDYETAENCPSTAYLNGHRPKMGECPVEHTVTRAMCQ